MKAKVLRKFRDKYTGKIHNPGDIIIVSTERFEEIVALAPLVEKVEIKKKAAE